MYRLTFTHTDGTESVCIVKEFSYNTNYNSCTMVYNHHVDILPLDDIIKMEVYNNGKRTLPLKVKSD